MMFFRVTLYGIIGAMLIGGFTALAAADKPILKKGHKLPTPAEWSQPVTNESAKVGPNGRIQNFGNMGFGEAQQLTPAQQRRILLKWPEMTQKEIDDLTATLKAVLKERGAPVQIVCKDPMCEDLALNLDNAFESARWKSEIVIGTQMGVPAGVTVSSRWLAGLLNAATANRYAAKVDETNPPPGPSTPGNVAAEYILIGAKPR